MTEAVSTKYRVRRLAGVVGGLGMCLASIGLVVPAFADPGPTPPLIGVIEIGATHASRVAHLDAWRARGYELLAPVRLVDASEPPSSTERP